MMRMMIRTRIWIRKLRAGINCQALKEQTSLFDNAFEKQKRAYISVNNVYVSLKKYRENPFKK